MILPILSCHPAPVLQPSWIQLFDISGYFSKSGQQDGIPYAHAYAQRLYIFIKKKKMVPTFPARSIFYPAILLCVFFLCFYIDTDRIETGRKQDGRMTEKRGRYEH